MLTFLNAEIEKFLAQLQRRGLRPGRIENLRAAIQYELDAAANAGEFVESVVGSIRTPTPRGANADPITTPSSPRAITSRRMAAIRLEDDPDSEREKP